MYTELDNYNISHEYVKEIDPTNWDNSPNYSTPSHYCMKGQNNAEKRLTIDITEVIEGVTILDYEN
jgi:hypothetical protein